MRLLPPVLILLGCLGCAHEISSEERLERETRRVALDEAAGAAHLEALSCEETGGLLDRARDVNRPETERVNDYIALYTDLKQKTRTFEEAMSRNPDLQYREGAQKYADAKDACVQQTADLRVEFERYVRDLVDLPAVQELKGTSAITVARLELGTLRKAIDTLDPEDREQLLSRVGLAEKKIAASANDDDEPARPRRGR